jgi:hypothetical protein
LSGLTWLILHVIAVQLRRQAPGLELLRLLVELGDAALELHPHPQVLVAIEAHAENAGRRLRLEQRNLVLGDLRRLRIELAEDLLAEARIPRHPRRVDDDVVRLARAFRQVVLGVDDARRLAGRPRQRRERRSSTSGRRSG